MKRYITLLLLLAGCASPTAYKTLYAVGHTTDAAIRAYDQQVIAGKIRTNGVPAVSAAYNHFQAALGGAIIISRFQLDNPAPSNVLWEASQVLILIESAKRK